MTELDLLYNVHKAYKNEISDQPALSRIFDYYSRHQRARSAYLECARIYNVHEMRMDRLATSHVDNTLINDILSTIIITTTSVVTAVVTTNITLSLSVTIIL